jgi:hypothetical protein
MAVTDIHPFDQAMTTSHGVVEYQPYESNKAVYFIRLYVPELHCLGDRQQDQGAPTVYQHPEDPSRGTPLSNPTAIHRRRRRNSSHSQDPHTQGNKPIFLFYKAHFADLMNKGAKVSHFNKNRQNDDFYTVKVVDADGKEKVFSHLGKEELGAYVDVHGKEKGFAVI